MRHVLLLVSAFLLLANRTAATAEVDYIDDVKSMLRHRCFACHGPLKQESELRLDTAAAIRRGGDNGPAIKSGKADKSLLIEKVTAADPDARMPPEGDPLTKQQIEILKAWINAGGPAPADEQPEKDPR
ncbi:MAG: c-type cytochrome domain-containing protein, partial [Planctomycetota bacterium]|nr:c-type cytochrome domain-containing protein [Planctomycetota bacterium]